MYRSQAKLQITLLSEWDGPQDFEIRYFLKFLGPIQVDFLPFFTTPTHNALKSILNFKNLASFIQNIRFSFIYLMIRLELKLTHGYEVLGSRAEMLQVLKNQIFLMKQRKIKRRVYGEVSKRLPLKNSLPNTDLLICLTKPPRYILEQLLPSQTIIYILEPIENLIESVLTKSDQTELTLVTFSKQFGYQNHVFCYETKFLLSQNLLFNHLRRIEKISLAIIDYYTQANLASTSSKEASFNIKKKFHFYQFIRYLLSRFGQFIVRQYEIHARVVPKNSRWAVGYVESYAFPGEIGVYKKVEVPENTYLADPFVFIHRGEKYIFVEKFTSEKRRGEIAAFRVTENGFEDLGTVISEDFHLSFPWIFEEDGKIYMCPESSAAGDIRLYEAIEFPTRWKFHSFIFQDILAVDSIIFKKDANWWLITNIDTTMTADFSAELFAFYSDSAVNGKWSPHKLNPIKANSEGGRNGGLFKVGAETYRVGQQRNFHKYGVGFTIFRITDLQPNCFTEEEFLSSKMYLSQFEFVHHFVVCGDICLFDFNLDSR